jgi:phosphoglycolate phosphatase
MSGLGKALLFDIDGTLADTDALHLEAFNYVFAPHGHVFDRDRASKELMGFSTASISERFLPCHSPERQAAIMAQKEEAFRTLASGQIKPLAGLMTLLARADRADVPIRHPPECRNDAFGSWHHAAVQGRHHRRDELAHGKPHPLPYLEGLRAVGAVPDRSLAFEDSRSGVQSASTAGIATIGMRTSLGHDDLIAAGAVRTAASFEDPELVRLVETTMNW